MNIVVIDSRNATVSGRSMIVPTSPALNDCGKQAHANAANAATFRPARRDTNNQTRKVVTTPAANEASRADGIPSPNNN